MRDKQALKDCELLAALSDDELEKIGNLAREKEYEAGGYIFHEGDGADELFVLGEGKVALQMTLLKEAGQVSTSISIDFVTRNEALGWSAIVEPYIHTLSAVCLQKAKVIAISGSHLRRLLEDNPNMGYKVLKGVTKVIAATLEDTRRVLVTERLQALKPEWRRGA